MLNLGHGKKPWNFDRSYVNDPGSHSKLNWSLEIFFFLRGRAGGKLESAETIPKGKARTNNKLNPHDSGLESNLSHIDTTLTLLCQGCSACLDIVLFFSNMLFSLPGYQSISPIFNWCYSGKFVCSGKCALVCTWWKKCLEILLKVKIFS